MAESEIIPFKGPRALVGLAARLPAVFPPDKKAAERFLGFFIAKSLDACDRDHRLPEKRRLAVRSAQDGEPFRYPRDTALPAGAGIQPRSMNTGRWGFEAWTSGM